MTTTVSRPEATTEGHVDDQTFDIAEPGRKRGRSWRVPIVLVLLLVVILVVVPVWWGSAGGGTQDQIDLFTVVPRSFPVLLREKGELKAAKSVDVKSKVEGRSTIIWLIEEGTEVKKGDLLVKLASDQIDEKVRSEAIKEANAAAAASAAEKEHEILIDQNASDLRKAQLALDMAELEMKKYLEGDWEQAKLDLVLELKRAQKILERADTELKASQELYARDFITQGDLYRDELTKLEADIALEKAELNKRITESYTHTKEREQRRSDVDEAGKELERVKKSNAAKEAKSLASREAKRAEWELTKERLAKYREQQANCQISAPQDGLVVYDTGAHRWDRRQIAEGAEVYERQTIIKLPDPSVMVVTVRIHEAKTDRIAVGQQVTVEVEGLPGRVFTGQVTKIATLADSQNMWLNPDLKEYRTEITLEENDAPLKPGVTARADIVVAELENVLAVPIQAVFTKAGHHFVFRKNGRDVEPIEVEVGRSSDQYVEISGGLAEGDRALLAVSDAQRRLLPDLEPRVDPRSQRAAKAKGPPGGKRRPGAGKRPRGGRKGPPAGARGKGRGK